MEGAGQRHGDLPSTGQYLRDFCAVTDKRHEISCSQASVLEVKGEFHESLEVRGGHAGTCAQGAEGCQRRFARRRTTSLGMT